MMKKIAYWIIFFLILFVFVAFRIPSLYPTLSDENVYFYMGKLISEGSIPYKDFFHAHPPLKIFLYAGIIKAFGFNLIILKSTALAATLISAFFIYLTFAKKNNHVSGLIAAFLFLFTATTFLFSTMNFGHNLTAMFMVIGYFYFTQSKYLLSGIFSGIASFTGIYAIPLIAVFIIVSLFSSNAKPKKYIYGFLAVFLFLNIIMIFLSGFDFIRQVYLFHFLKTESGTASKLSLIRDMAVSNMILSVPLLIYAATKLRLHIILEEMLVILYVLFIFLLKTPFMFYFVVMFPFAAVLGAEGIIKAVKILPKSAKIFFVITVFVIFVFSINRNLIFEINQNKQNKFTKSDEIANYVRSHSKPDDTIAGDTYITPLISLKSNRRIAGDIVDIDTSIFKTGVYKLNSVVDKLIEKKVKFMLMHRVGTKKSQFWYRPELEKIRPFCSSEDKAIKFTENNNIYLIYECNFL